MQIVSIDRMFIQKAKNTARAVFFYNWSGKRDSNSRPRPWQGRALPAELFPQSGRAL